MAEPARWQAALVLHGQAFLTQEQFEPGDPEAGPERFSATLAKHRSVSIKADAVDATLIERLRVSAF